MRLKAPGEYIRAIRELRKYADGFTAADGYDLRALKSKKASVALTRSQKARVTKYFDVLQRHAGYKGTRYQAFADKRKLKEAQAVMGMPTGGSWRGVFVPQPEGQRARLVKVKGKWVVSYKGLGLESVFVPFDKVLFAVEGVDYVRDLLAPWPDDWRYNLDMGYGRERWRLGGTKHAFLADLGRLIMANMAGVSGSSAFEDYMMGAHVYRGASGTSEEFQEVRRETLDEMRARRAKQETRREEVKKERRVFALERAKVKTKLLTPSQRLAALEAEEKKLRRKIARLRKQITG